MKKLLLFPALLMLTAGCDNQQIAESKSNRGFLRIDTISIHGKSHEVVRDIGNHRGGIMHSPECWCGKEESKQ